MQSQADREHFNSSVVRFRAGAHLSCAPVLLYFNSSVVRFRGKRRYIAPEAAYYFNSSVVRFRADVVSLKNETKIFQFQCGAI